MKQKEINKQIFKRIKKLEKAVFAKGIKSNQNKRESKLSDKVSLPNLILELRDGRFFSKPKSVGEIHDKLSQVYPCKIDRIDTALRRLKERKKLRITNRIIKSKRVLAYVW